MSALCRQRGGQEVVAAPSASLKGAISPSLYLPLFEIFNLSPTMRVPVKAAEGRKNSPAVYQLSRNIECSAVLHHPCGFDRLRIVGADVGGAGWGLVELGGRMWVISSPC